MNPVNNRIYVANQGNNTVTVIDGATNQTNTVPAGSGPQSVAVNPITHAVYVANFSSNNITEFTEEQVQSIPLATTIGALANNQTGSGTPILQLHREKHFFTERNHARRTLFSGGYLGASLEPGCFLRSRRRLRVRWLRRLLRECIFCTLSRRTGRTRSSSPLP